MSQSTARQYKLLFGILHNSTKYYKIIQSTSPYTTQNYKHRTTKYYKVLQSTTPHHNVWQNTARHYKVLLDILHNTRKSLILLLRTTKLDKFGQSMKQCYQVLLRTTNYHSTSPCHKARDPHCSLLYIFFWTMLRASLQLWQSLSCAKIVIVGQRGQKERSGTENTKQPKQTPKQSQHQATETSLTNRVKVKPGETRWNKLRLSRQSTIPGSHNVFSRK